MLKKENNQGRIKAGLEIHQQLDTGKLFCRCPSILRRDEPDWIAHRKLHAVAGESGEVDIAVKHETLKSFEFVYQGYKDTNCLLEYDECPPYPINQEALKIAVQVALILNCEIIPVSQIMRKTVLDGSNTSGFQRTVLIARGGWFETSAGKVRIQTVMLEEDAARLVEKKEGQVIYRLDRLGIPLIEIATSPDLHSAEQIKEAALKLGEIVRACKVRRGLGTIRQDMNISVGAHPRVEIKGFQNPAMMIKTIELETERQLKNLLSLEKKEALRKKETMLGKPEVRKANEDGSTGFLRPMPGAARMYPETDLPLLKITRDFINEVKKELPKLKESVKGELKAKGLSEEMISQLLGSRMLGEFEALLKVYNNPNFVAKALLILPKEVASHENIPAEKINEIFTIDIIESILQAITSRKIREEDAKQIMEKIAAGKSFAEAIKVEKADMRHVEAEIAKIVREKPGLSVGAYMGLVMEKFRGKIEGRAVMDILRKLVK